MALARQCTRCNSFYASYYSKGTKDNYNALIKIDRDLNDKFYSINTIDLCPECKNSFELWLNNCQNSVEGSKGEFDK